DSTNTFLKNLLSNSKPLPEGTVIMAESQYAGRGQQQNKWHSEPGKNLTFSILLTPSFLAITSQFDLNRVVSLGVFDALRPYLGEQLKIKWPNDIYYEDRKLGGILIETHVQGSQIKNAIIGIGLNINQENFDPGAGNAISLRQILHRDYDLRTILSEICSSIEAYYLNLKAGKVLFIRNAYLDKLYWLNQVKRFRADDLIFEGIIRDVKNEGILVVENDQVRLEFSFKQIEFLNK
ncbi:MAG: biotin--[acetyl-CoA-carboxylase] ligase, partial [Mucilaginibacter sp.]|uniref:biotin--[acetyl-CoA-carboxylase] ligase n=1 Tax=Mucilaginibacter sp. TaxID=1882438 RepID=UPI0031AFF129